MGWEQIRKTVTHVPGLKCNLCARLKRAKPQPCLRSPDCLCWHAQRLSGTPPGWQTFRCERDRDPPCPTWRRPNTWQRRVAALARPGDAILLDGPLGAGKTAFARAFLRAATGDPRLEVPSPSFTLVQSYDTGLGPVHHFDLWRLGGPGGLAELGWDEACADIVLVEWPDRLGAAWPGGCAGDHPDARRRRGAARRADRLARPHRPPGMSRATDDRGVSRPARLRGRARRALGPGRQLPALSAARRRAASGGADGRAAARGCRPFLRIAAHLAGLGLSVPDIIAADLAAGLVLEEDLGDEPVSGAARRQPRPFRRNAPSPTDNRNCSTPPSTSSWRCIAPRRRPTCPPGTPPP